jgi:hypothetical protein
MEHDPEREQLLSELNRLRDHYYASLPAERKALEQLWKQLQAPSAERALLAELERLLRRISGNNLANELEQVSIYAERAIQLLDPYLKQQLSPNPVLINNLRPSIEGVFLALSETARSSLKLIK